MPASKDQFGSKTSLDTRDGRVHYYALSSIQKAGLIDLAKTPFTIRILLENVLRQADGGPATVDHVRLVSSWRPEKRPEREFPYMPARVVLQDFTGVPCVVDLAAMRDAVRDAGGDPSIINPIVRSDLVIDHSVQVDYFANAGALAQNIEREFERNVERYQFLKWAQGALSNMRVVPPGTGIVHQVNLEYLAPVVMTAKKGSDTTAYPDTCVGTDSHTTMINGLGVLGWGVGGIEAEAVMLGQPYYMLVPEVVGVRLTGSLPEGATATDLVLTLTQILRKTGVVEKFVEFYGPGLPGLPLADRATIGNMAPEYGATCGFFPVDEQTLKYMRDTGRPDALVDLTERYCKAQGLFHIVGDEPQYSTRLEFNLASVVPSLAGPKRPQDRVVLQDMSKNFFAAYPDGPQPDRAAGKMWERPFRKPVEIEVEGGKAQVGDGAVVIAAITSCTNTSNPSVMIGAGLLARKARQKGLNRKAWVKSSLAPGSTVVTEYLNAAGVSADLDALGFNLVGYGCTTCIGNSGPLPQPVATAIQDHNFIAAAVLSGNRNFEGRVHPQVQANYLASPMLVVAYAIAGRVDVDLTKEPIGQDQQGADVFLKDIWPSQREISDTMANALKADMFRAKYGEAFSGPKEWQALAAPTGTLFKWDAGSTYIQKPPYFENFGPNPTPRGDVAGARVLVSLGDSVTTDHISPAGSIPPSAPAGQFLIGHDVPRRDFNSFGSRRGNHDVMVRGTFGNIRLKNALTPDKEGDWTQHFPTGEVMRIFDAAERYRNEGVPLIVIAGKEYGTGSSRDWAAKGPMLLGVRAAIAESFERIHRSNLIGMGVLPLQFKPGENLASLGLTGREQFDIPGISNGVAPGSEVTITATMDGGSGQGSSAAAHAGGSRSSGATKRTFKVMARIDTEIENEYFRHGGLLPYVLRQMMGK
ncbi:MAG: aconitate hydratase AcnA [Dehalococcoidia bacterium]|nr:aconitate hydratase AcnA [Dehalococcoidia bacterium]